MQFNPQCQTCTALCCKNIPIGHELSKEGTTICVFLLNDRCTIYEERPIYCNVTKAYDEGLIPDITREEWFELNYISCNSLKTLEDNKEIDETV